MPSEIPKQYDPAAAQSRWYAEWSERGEFNAEPNSEKSQHTIMIPLPNVTGALHMGHALNGTLQDLITRWKRMQGFEALWMPGTDHAGIATQAVVERRMLEEEGLTRHDVGREALVERIWTWKDSYEQKILSQLKLIGASCDWRRTRFTLDDVCSKAVRRTFFKLFNDGLIYRGKRLVNWDSFLQTAVANDEVFYEAVEGGFWTFRYKVVDSDETIGFSTTRPETMLGDTAVCVHPGDERYAHLVGRSVHVPLVDREIPIIADALLAKQDLGTGAVKVTPAHDPNDYACGLRNDLPMINILDSDGTINGNGGQFSGLDRYEARTRVVEAMDELGLYDGCEDRAIDLAHSDRSKTPIEPYLSDQWFVKMDNLAQSAIDAVEDGRVTFFPSRYAKTYLDWLGEKRDWCVSRQLWWGHRIPIWYCRTCQSEDLEAAFADRADVCWREDDENGGWLVCAETDLEGDELGGGHELVQDEDVLDTWFSSALWPHSTLGWPDSTASLDYFYPGSVLVTSRDIITLWVARMVLAGLYNMGEVPFSHVCVHPKILDGFGQTMSKSKGNGVDPLDLIDRYGADAVRFTIAGFAGETQDIRLPVGYECPGCGHVTPQEIQHQQATPGGGEKPRVECGGCGKAWQYSSPWYVPDEGEPVARMVAERFEAGRNFCNKFWNAARFAMLNLEGYEPGPIPVPGPGETSELAIEDRWILSRLSRTAAAVTGYLDGYQFDQATRTLRDFTRNEFCDWYLEMVKSRLQSESGDGEARATAQRVLVGVLDALLRLLAPVIPFITEELWERLSEWAECRGLPLPEPAAQSVMRADWVVLPTQWQDEQLEGRFERLQELIVAVRNVRSTYSIPRSTRLSLSVRCEADVAEDLESVAEQFLNLANSELIALGPEVRQGEGAASFALGEADGYIDLEGVVDREAERAKHLKEIEKLNGVISGHEKKLSNESFVSKAPAEVVDGVRDTLAGLREQLERVNGILGQLGDG